MKQRKVKRLLAFFVAISMCFGLVPYTTTVTRAAAKKLKVTSAKSVAINCSITIKTNVKSTFKSSNKKIATVSKKGVVKGKKAGKVKITVTSKGNKNQKKTVKITVKKQLVVTAPKGAKSTLEVGESVKIKTNLSSNFVSSDTDVATVDTQGEVVAKGKGTAKITVTSKKYKNLKKTVAITVNGDSEESTTQTQTTTQVQATTQVQTTTQEPPKVTTEEPLVSGDATTESPSTEESTTETPSDEPKVIGIEATYRGKAVPTEEAKYMGDQRYYDVYKIYDTGEKELINPEDRQLDGSYEGITTENELEYVNVKITYRNFSTDIKIRVIELSEDDSYTRELSVSYHGKEPIKQGEMPSLEDFTFITYDSKGNEEQREMDLSQCIITFDSYNFVDLNAAYLIRYYSTITDSNGNEITTCVYAYEYIKLQMD